MKQKLCFGLQVGGVITFICLTITSQSWWITKQNSITEFLFYGKRLGHFCPSGFKEKTEDLLCKKPIKFDPKFKNPCWFEENRDTRDLKCLPYFLVIGMQKCGTTDIYDALGKHPEIVKPKTTYIYKKSNTNKEFHFFDVYHHVDAKHPQYTSFDKYVNYFTPIAHRLQQNKSVQFITGEGSPDYFYYFKNWDQIPQNYNKSKPVFVLPSLIKKIIPDVKMILSLRKPEYRTLSAYFHVVSRNYGRRLKMTSAVSDFRRIVTKGLKDLRICMETKGEEYCTTNNETILKFPQIYPGMYDVFLKQWLNYFPREQIHIVNFENYRKDKAKILNEVFKFLKIRQLNITEMTNRKMLLKQIRNHGVTVNKTAVKENLDELREFFKPHNANLKSLLQDNESKILDWY